MGRPQPTIPVRKRNAQHGADAHHSVVNLNNLQPAKSHGCKRVRGFTLVEVLVAMAILAIGVSALVTASGASAHRSKLLSDREFGRWIAANHLNTIQAMPGAPNPGTSSTVEVEMMNRTWYVKTRAKKEDLDLIRLDIEVRLDKDADGYIYSVTGFAGSQKHSF